jgi:hypothetical protein
LFLKRIKEAPKKWGQDETYSVGLFFFGTNLATKLSFFFPGPFPLSLPFMAGGATIVIGVDRFVTSVL